MNKVIITCFLLCLHYSSSAQETSILEESFTGMFEIEPTEPYIPEGIQGPLNPAVPLDGGLTALLVAGGAVGYRKLRAHKLQRAK
jgi:hypothetical protein